MKVSTLNFGSFAEIVATAILFSLMMGFTGGFLPAVRAARLNIVKALRAS